MPGPWTKARASQNNGGCVEVRTADDPTNFDIRDSKLGDASEILSLPKTDMAAMTRAIADGTL